MKGDAAEIPAALLAIIALAALAVVIGFGLALRSFLRAGRADAAERRRRGSRAKNPLDPDL